MGTSPWTADSVSGQGCSERRARARPCLEQSPGKKPKGKDRVMSPDQVGQRQALRQDQLQFMGCQRWSEPRWRKQGCRGRTAQEEEWIGPIVLAAAVVLTLLTLIRSHAAAGEAPSVSPTPGQTLDMEDHKMGSTRF